MLSTKIDSNKSTLIPGESLPTPASINSDLATLVDKTAKISLEKTRDNRAMIAVLGETQSGKSKFINTLLEYEGQNLTQKRAKEGSNNFSVTKRAKLYELNTELLLMDTPGLDDTHSRDDSHLQNIVFMMHKANKIACPIIAIKFDQAIGKAFIDNVTTLFMLLETINLPAIILHTNCSPINDYRERKLDRIKSINEKFSASGKLLCHFFIDTISSNDVKKNYALKFFSDEFEAAKKKTLKDILTFVKSFPAQSTEQIYVPKLYHLVNSSRNTMCAANAISETTIDVVAALQIDFGTEFQQYIRDITDLSYAIGKCHGLINENKHNLACIDVDEAYVAIEQVHEWTLESTIHCIAHNATGYKLIKGEDIEWNTDSTLMLDSVISASYQLRTDGKASGCIIATTDRHQLNVNEAKELKEGLELYTKRLNDQKGILRGKLKEAASIYLRVVREIRMKDDKSYAENETEATDYMDQFVLQNLAKAFVEAPIYPLDVYTRLYQNHKLEDLINYLKDSDLFKSIRMP